MSVALISVAFEGLDRLKAAGIEANIAEPNDKKGPATSLTFNIMLNGEKTIDETILAKAKAIVKALVEYQNPRQHTKLVANATRIYLQKAKAPK
jgi:hypothetical protein